MFNPQQQLLAAILAGTAAHNAGMAIYIGNREAVALRAFGNMFPTTQQLLGDAFRSAVMLFIQQCPSPAAELTGWGAGFADWLSQHAGLQTYRYVAAVAALEWQIGVLERAADVIVDVGSFDLLQQLNPDELRIVLNPHCVLLHSDLPVYAIWSMHQHTIDLQQLNQLNLSALPADYVEYICVSRLDWKAEVTRLTQDEFQLLLLCQRSIALSGILAELTKRQMLFSDWLSRMLSLGVICGYAALALPAADN